MGGFLGSDDSPSVGQLQQWTTEGKLKYVLSGSGSDRGMPDMNGGAGMSRRQWIEQHCTAVDPAVYGGQPPRQAWLNRTATTPCRSPHRAPRRSGLPTVMASNVF
ncbi:hypothetical protein ACFWMR_10330 [Amycolatopsis thailandensis]|uniref:hypothetical protein n=1 Tax=Amycolatopsis thailandensis TaxID=589330 RepID=UPI003656B5E2